MEEDDAAVRAHYELGTLQAARAIERVPELIGFGPHLIATGIRS